tara:strand:+ start:14654 stop:14878 length:225 start_codon:yes stop_codon:yes gene_type:complete
MGSHALSNRDFCDAFLPKVTSGKEAAFDKQGGRQGQTVAISSSREIDLDLLARSWLFHFEPKHMVFFVPRLPSD